MTASASPKPDRRFRRRDAVVQTAVELINEKGVHGMTLAEVAARLDIVATGVAYYFRRKEQLAATCFLQAIDRFQQIVGEAAPQPTPFQRVAAVFRAYAALYADICEGSTPPIVHFHDAQALGDEEVNAAFVRLFRSFRGLLVTADAPVDATALAAQTHQLLAALFWSRRIMESHDSRYFAQIADGILDILRNGIGALAAGESAPALPLEIPPPGSPSDVGPERFLKAATELINDQGYAGASVERISARLKVTKGSFYHHVETKHDLVIQCLERTIAIMRAAQRQADEQGGSGLQEIYASFAALIDFQMSEAGPLLALKAVVSIPNPERDALLKQFGRLSNRSALVIGRGIADGSIRPIDAHIGAELLLAITNAVGDLRLWAPELDKTTIDAAYTRPFFAGLLAH